MNLESRLKRLIALQMGLSEDSIRPSSRLREDLRIDSLDAVELGIRIEEEFGMRVDPGDVFTFQDLLRKLKEVMEDGDTAQRSGDN